MTVATWLVEAQEKLQAAGFEAGRLESQLLLAHHLGHDRAWILAHPEAPITATEELQSLLRRRLEEKEPLAYILGYREFYGRKFKIGPGALIPRQDTEVVVEAALETIDRLQAKTVLEVGSGSGAIAVTLKLERPCLEVTAIDISSAALDWTRTNASDLGARIKVLESNFFSALPREQTFDLIVSNPPYIGRGEMLDDEVALHEPEEALYAGETGLDAFEVLARDGRQHLQPRGEMWLEMGYRQENEVVGIFTSNGWHLIRIEKDLAGHPRAAGFRLNPA